MPEKKDLQEKEASPRSREIQFNTSDTYTKGVLVYDVALAGDWPNIVFRYNWQLKIRCTGYNLAWYINGCDFWFHNQHKPVNINLTLGGNQTSGALASGTVDIPWAGGENRCTHAPGYGITTALWSGSGVLDDTLTIPTPSVYEVSGVSNITATSATVSYKLSNVRNFWRLGLRQSGASSKFYSLNPDTRDGSINITGLTPESTYKMEAEVYDRNGNWFTTGTTTKTFTTLVDQIKVWIRQGNALKKARVWIRQGNTLKKVKKMYIREGNNIRKVKGA